MSQFESHFHAETQTCLPAATLYPNFERVKDMSALTTYDMHKITVKDFPHLDFGDVRHNERFVTIMNKVNSQLELLICIRIKNLFHFLSRYSLNLLSFVCPKERSKEKGRQNELLRSFCHAHAQLIELTGRDIHWLCYFLPHCWLTQSMNQNINAMASGWRYCRRCPDALLLSGYNILNQASGRRRLTLKFPSKGFFMNQLGCRDRHKIFSRNKSNRLTLCSI